METERPQPLTILMTPLLRPFSSYIFPMHSIQPLADSKAYIGHACLIAGNVINI